MLSGAVSLPFQIPAGATVQAAPGARPIFVAQNGYAPYIEVQDGATVDGIWFGGAPNPPPEVPFIIKNSTTIKNCTFFNYYGGLGEGSGSGNTIQGCRFVACGAGNLYHAIYISNGAVDHWIDVLDNVFIGGAGGYAVHCFHGPTNATIRRNFFGDVHWMIAAEGSGHIVEDNVLWSSNGAIGCTWFQDNPLTVQHNLAGVGIDYTVWDHPGPGRICDNNTFYAGCPYPFGTNQHTVTSVAGIDGAALETAITAIETAFTDTVANIHAASVEGAFATLSAAPATWAAQP